MNVMVDSNILISAALFKSQTSVETLGFASTEHNQLLISDYVINESRRVTKKKWPKHLQSLNVVLDVLDYMLVELPPELPPDPYGVRDPKDYPVLYAALIGRADVLVTGDKDLLELQTPPLPIVSPATFINNL